MISEYWQKFVHFLADYDLQKVSEVCQSIDWGDLLQKPLFWIITVPVLAWVLWKKYFRFLMVSVSALLLVVLIQRTLPGDQESIPLDQLLSFIGGCAALVVVNFYFLFVRRS